MIAIAILSIMSIVATLSLGKHYKIYKFNSHAYAMENIVKWAKLTSMERSINVGICVDSKVLKIMNLGTQRTGVCSGDLLNKLEIKDDFAYLSGSGCVFDPRGFAALAGDVCVTNNERYYKACINRFGALRIEKGSGGCSPCAN